MTVYRWRAADASFAAAWDAALKIGITALEDEAHRRAFEGTDKPIVHLGKVTGHMKEYSDTLAIFLLKAHAPEKYRERAQVDVTNSDGSLQLDETARAARLAQLLAKAQERKAAEGGDEGCDLA